MAHSLEMRQKAIAYWEECKDINLVIKAYGVGHSTLFSWKKLKHDAGSLAAVPLNRPARKIDRDKLRAYVAEHPGAYLFEIAELFNCSASGVFYALKSLGITH